MNWPTLVISEETLGGSRQKKKNAQKTHGKSGHLYKKEQKSRISHHEKNAASDLETDVERLPQAHRVSRISVRPCIRLDQKKAENNKYS